MTIIPKDLKEEDFKAMNIEQEFMDALNKVNNIILKKMKRVRASHEAKYQKALESDKKKEEDKMVDAHAIIDLMEMAKNEISEMVKVYTEEGRSSSPYVETKIRHIDMIAINTDEWQTLLKEFQTLTSIMIRTLHNWKYAEQRYRGSKKSS